jgi:DNA-binding transcriptional regulator GbsR (MarR family)
MNSDHVMLAKNRLIESAGRMTQDFGMGRIVGQVMAILYLTPCEASLDDLEKQLGLSKAAISIASRQLESMGLVQRVWLPGDKKNYYKIVDNLAAALQRGVFDMVRAKLSAGAEDLEFAKAQLTVAPPSDEVKFLKERVKRAEKIRSRASSLLNNPLLKLIGG